MDINSQNKGTVILTWTKAFADEGISHYRIYLDDKVIGNTLDDSNKYVAENMKINVALTFYVIAVTKLCKVSKRSNGVTITLTTYNEVKSLNYDLDFFI